MSGVDQKEAKRQLVQLISSCPTLLSYFKDNNFNEEKWPIAFGSTISAEVTVWKMCCLVRDKCYRLFEAHTIIINKMKDKELSSDIMKEVMGFVLFMCDQQCALILVLYGYNMMVARLNKTSIKFMYNYNYIAFNDLSRVKKYCTSAEAVALLSNNNALINAVLSTSDINPMKIVALAVDMQCFPALQRYIRQLFIRTSR
jgi:hypothetical protein